jgi:hypothetical protein
MPIAPFERFDEAAASADAVERAEILAVGGTVITTCTMNAAPIGPIQTYVKLLR